MDEITTTLPKVVQLNLELLDQAATAIRALSDRYRTSPDPGQSPVGAHVRHVVDHYACFFRGIESGSVDYYTRERSPDLESDPERAIAALDEVKDKLIASAHLLGQRLAVDTGGPHHEGGEARWAPSSVQREMAFVLSHTLHHMAIIRVAAQRMGVDLDEEVGFAHSTLAHQARPSSPSHPTTSG